MISPWILALFLAKGLRSQAMEWQRSIDDWIEKDKKSFNQFKKNVFSTISDSKHKLGTDGFEKL